MSNEIVNLRELAREAAGEVRDDLLAGRCWFGHKNTRWETRAGGRVQSRWCVSCGRAQERVVSSECVHVWKEFGTGIITKDGTSNTPTVGTFHKLRCNHCGDVMRRSL